MIDREEEIVAEIARIRKIHVATLNSGEFSYIDGTRFSSSKTRNSVDRRYFGTARRVIGSVISSYFKEKGIS